DGPCPIISVPEVYEYYARAGELGFGNILSGELAEFVVAMSQHLLGHLLSHGRWRSLGSLLAAQHRQGTRWKTLLKMLALPFIPPSLYQAYQGLRGIERPARIPEWLDRTLFHAHRAHARADQSLRQAWLNEQMAGFDGCTITMEADDLCAALCGVTVRRPF